jgi:cellulose synthase/poly-beta-1,6-N-acetylglucosamine synthase-like glycosyltransferase
MEFELKVISILVLIILVSLFSYTCYCESYKNINPKEKVSVYILNYKRPHNLELSLPILNNMKWVDEIIVSHGHPDGFRDFKFSKVKNIKDYDNNEKYGAGRRFLLPVSNFKNNLILTLDDDHIPSDHLLKRLIVSGEKDPNQIYGPYSRECNEEGYWFNSKKPNVVLTGLSLVSKYLISNFQSKFKTVEPILIKFKGNGDDLTFNYIFRKDYNKTPKYIDGDYIELDTKGGYSFTRGHNDTRDKICQELADLD